MAPNSLLTEDELAFIRNLQDNPQMDAHDDTPNLQIQGGTQVKDLLTRLAAHEHVTIQAQFENQQLSFPLHRVSDGFAGSCLQLGTPSIFEDGPMIRPWRLVLTEPVALVDELGLSTNLWLREISVKGVLIEARQQPKPPRQFACWFSPPGLPAIALRGSLQRETLEGLAAYKLKPVNVEETERLDHYLLQQHLNSHPELHA